MQVIKYPNREEWKYLLQRPYVDNHSVVQTVQAIFQEVKARGDVALRAYTKNFDGIDVNELQVSVEEIAAAERQVSTELKQAIQTAKANIEVFHQKQQTRVEVIETMPGIQCWRKSIGIERVGFYIPGGTAPLFSTVLMLAIPAGLAGCKEIVLCSPPGVDGNIHPAVLYAAQCCGISKIYKVGGAQAIAAMAYGTESIPAVYKIFGPGNQYVTAAKELVQLAGVAIDIPAGPSEVCVLADDTADPAFVAADLLSQAEHGPDSQVLLVCTDEQTAKGVEDELAKQIPLLKRKAIAEKALLNSKILIVKEINDAVDLVNAYAAEHLILQCANADAVAGQIINAGSVFIGQWSPESVGDYASGTNHTLPTNGFARAYSGVSVDSFVKKITYQKLSEEGLQNIADTVVCLANAEGLDAHAQAVKIRMKKRSTRA